MNKEIIAARSAEVILGPNPIIGFRARDLAREALTAAKLAATQPSLTARSGTALSRELWRVARGQSELAPQARDRRFADPDWQNDPRYKRWLQSWLALQTEVGHWIEQQDLPDGGRARLEFLSQLLIDGVAPSNFPIQPTALKTFRESGGQSAVNGLKNLLNDLRENRGLPAQVDKTKFKVGDNLATTEGTVILRTELIELIQYKPRTAKVRKVPILVVPPQINKFYVFDLSPEKSVARGLLDAGMQTFVISWRNPTAQQRDWGLAEYAAAIDTAVSAVCALTGQDKINLAGACAGGITLSSYVAARAAAGDKRVNSLTLLVNVLDQGGMDDTPLGLFASPSTIRAAKEYSAKKGVLDGKDMATAFAWLRPNDLIWSYWINNILLGNKPPAFDVLYWNNDSTRLPARLHGEFIDIYRTNAMAKPGTLRLHGVPVDLGKVDCDNYLIAGVKDHITPWRACYATTQLFSGQSTFVLSNSGHIQSILNPPGNKKAEYWVGDETPAQAGSWQKKAQRQDGSWWPHWHEWLQSRSGPERNAPKKTGNADYPALAPAPGEYVHG